jgi:glycosyl transferase family 9 (putative heptosyltransferase)
LTRLMSSLQGVTIATSTEQLERDPRPMRWLPLMSAPTVLGTTLDNLPADVPYLFPQPEAARRWGQRLAGDEFKVGICWRTGPMTNWFTRVRSIPLAAFAPLAALPGVRLITVQKGDGLEELETVPFRHRIENISGEIDDLADTAAVMANLDLVVSCDTSVPHLAGALARPVFLALAYMSDWRWLLDREDNPWYPTMRLFRQGQAGEWGSIMERIATAVADLAGRKRGGI